MLVNKNSGNITFSLIFMVLVSFILISVFNHYKSSSEVLNKTRNVNASSFTLDSITELTTQVLEDRIIQKDYNFTWDGHEWVTSSAVFDLEDIISLKSQIETVAQSELGLGENLGVDVTLYETDCSSPLQPLHFTNPHTTSICVRSKVEVSGVSLISTYKLESITYDFNESGVIGAISVGFLEFINREFVY